MAPARTTSEAAAATTAPAPAGEPPAPAPGRRRPALGETGRNAVAVAVAWIVLIAATTVHRQDFLSHDTLLAVAFAMAITGVLAAGMAMVTLSGGFLDLSVPAATVLPAMLAIRVAQEGAATGVLVAVALAAGAGWGLMNAAIIVLARVNPLIVTLGTNLAGIAALDLAFDQLVMPRDIALRSFGSSQFLGLPSVWWVMLAVLAVAALVVTKTRYGRHVVAVGGNPVAALQRGISVPRIRFSVFVIAGLCGGVAALLFVAQNGSAQPSDGNSLLLPVVATVILGGISLTGGRGQLLALLLSGAFLATVPTSLVFFGASTYWQQVMQGVLLMVAVSVDGVRRKRARNP